MQKEPFHQTLPIMSSDSEKASAIELQFIEAFVVPEKRQRLAGFFRSSKNRWKGLLELQHLNSGILDVRCSSPITPPRATAEQVARLLMQHGAPEECYVFSNSKTIDRQFMRLDDALQRVWGIGLGTVISLIPGRLAYFEGELYPDQHVLVRK